MPNPLPSFASNLIGNNNTALNPNSSSIDSKNSNSSFNPQVTADSSLIAPTNNGGNNTLVTVLDIAEETHISTKPSSKNLPPSTFPDSIPSGKDKEFKLTYKRSRVQRKLFPMSVETSCSCSCC